MSSIQRVRSSTVRIGCSGWQYRHWRGDFYPADLPARRWFEHYASRFDTVEINSTFYRLPESETFADWARRAPAGFLFAVKASRFLTHMRKLKDPAAPLALFYSRARRLGPALGPVLYQLPPRWPLNLDRLRRFLRVLPRDVPQAIEFRDPSWYAEEALALLDRAGVALCLHDMPGSESCRRTIGPFVYVRFHGGQRGGGRYADDALEEWGRWLAASARKGRKVYAYFNNDAGGHAPRDAVRLRDTIARHASR